MKYLLDTCVISELVMKTPDPHVVAFVDSLEPDDVFFSVITIGEIVKGIEKLSDSKQKRELHTWLQEDLLIRFDGKIFPLDTNVLMEWGKLTAHAEAAGKPMPAIDSLIAATVLTYELTLITRNVSDFDSAGIQIVNPWGFDE
ncbi:MAG: type II toxin-antitoxin system VapC family toxin [Chloroflexi bacterium]|nr:type II toxin-antitoxin system VapC family toxin [Chloroflexota bacterium]